LASDKPESLRSVERALGLLEALARSDREMGVTELSKQTSLSKSVVHRLLRALESRGYVKQDVATEKYHLTLKLFEIGAASVNRLGIKRAASGPMSELASRCRETVNLAVLDGRDVIYVDRVESNEILRIELQVGTRVPAHCSALGKVLLAYSPETRTREALRGMELRRYTPTTITSLSDLEIELRKVRRLGYAVDNEEYISGLRCVAAPIRNHEGIVVAALSIAAPSVRLTQEAASERVREVCQAALSISRSLGYKGSAAPDAGQA